MNNKHKKKENKKKIITRRLSGSYSSTSFSPIVALNPGEFSIAAPSVHSLQCVCQPFSEARDFQTYIQLFELC